MPLTLLFFSLNIQNSCTALCILQKKLLLISYIYLWDTKWYVYTVWKDWIKQINMFIISNTYHFLSNGNFCII
jgi:hypothetical protein